jgi:hypothetical protein
MARVSVSKEIATAPEKVWAVFTDLPRYPAWLTLHHTWASELPLEIGEGTRVSERISVLGTAQHIDWTVDEYRAPRLAALSGVGAAGLAVRLVMSVEQAGESAMSHIDVTFSGGLVAGLLGRVVAKSVKKDLTASADNLATLLG